MMFALYSGHVPTCDNAGLRDPYDALSMAATWLTWKRQSPLAAQDTPLQPEPDTQTHSHTTDCKRVMVGC